MFGFHFDLVNSFQLSSFKIQNYTNGTVTLSERPLDQRSWASSESKGPFGILRLWRNQRHRSG
jgi:hypothetical protein